MGMCNFVKSICPKAGVATAYLKIKIFPALQVTANMFGEMETHNYLSHYLYVM